RGANLRMLDHRVDLPAAYYQCAKQVSGKSSSVEDFLNCERAAGHVGCMLEHSGVSRHQTGRGEAEDLPEWEIPWHYGEYDPEPIKGDKALARLGSHRLAREKFLGMLGIEITRQAALLRFGHAIAHGLAHLLGH